MILINYLKDNENYRIWETCRPNGSFDVITKEQFKVLLDLDNKVFCLIDYEDIFLNGKEVK